jgi:hypothetical protein
VSSTSERVTWVAISTFGNKRLDRATLPPAVRALVFRTPLVSVREPRTAGAIPNSTAVRMQVLKVKTARAGPVLRREPCARPLGR